VPSGGVVDVTLAAAVVCAIVVVGASVVVVGAAVVVGVGQSTVMTKSAEYPLGALTKIITPRLWPTAGEFAGSVKLMMFETNVPAGGAGMSNAATWP